jgi:hypothetical protein
MHPCGLYSHKFGNHDHHVISNHFANHERDYYTYNYCIAYRVTKCVTFSVPDGIANGQPIDEHTNSEPDHGAYGVSHTIANHIADCITDTVAHSVTVGVADGVSHWFTNWVAFCVADSFTDHLTDYVADRLPVHHTDSITNSKSDNFADSVALVLANSDSE